MKRISLWAGWIILGILLTGCHTSQLEQLTPNQIISQSAERMAGLKGFEFLIERSGEPVFLDYQETISFRRAEGKFTSPDRVYASVRVIAPALVTEVQIISIGTTQWETNLLTGQWQVSDPRYSFNPSLLFNPETGIPIVLARELTDARLLDMEEIPEVPGKRLYVIETVMQGERAYQMTFGMIDNEPLHVKLWIDPTTFDLYRIILVDPANPGDQQDTTWQIDFWSFGNKFEIEPPILKH